MAYFEFNGEPCLHPGQLLSDCERNGFAVSEWIDRANSFTARRGPDPSTGYLLLSSLPPQTGPNKKEPVLLRIRYEDGLFEGFDNVWMDWARKITPASTEDKGYWLVKVADERDSLTTTFVSKRLNFVTSYDPSHSQFIYDSATIEQVLGDGTQVPWTWEKLFKGLWVVPSGLALTVDPTVTFPAYVPQDLDWRYVTRRDALEMLCQWTNTTIIYSGVTGAKVVPVSNAGNLFQQAIAPLEAASLKSNDTWHRTGIAGHEAPTNVDIYFHYLHTGKTNEYLIIPKVPTVTPQSPQSLSLRLPCYSTPGATPPANQNPQTVATNFIASQANYWNQFPSQEKTYYGSYKFSPSGFLEEVTWYDHATSGSRTHVTSISPRNWIINPYKVNELDELTICIGRVKTGQVVTKDTATFAVDDIRVISGSLPSAILPGSRDNQAQVDYVTVLNDFDQPYSVDQKVLIFRKTGDDPQALWDTDAVGAGGAGGLTHFEILEDKHTTDYSVRATLAIPGGGLPNQNSDFYVVDPQNIYQGYKAWNDSHYGQQKGFRGYAYKFTDNYFNGKAGFLIVEMEHVCRFCESNAKEDFTGNDGQKYKSSAPDVYWDGRSPKTEGAEAITGGTYIRYQDRNGNFGNFSEGIDVTLVWDEKVECFQLFISPQVDPEPPIRHFLLIGTVPGCTTNAALGETTPGKSETPVAILQKRSGTDIVGGAQSGKYIPERDGPAMITLRCHNAASYTAIEASNSKPVTGIGYLIDPDPANPSPLKDKIAVIVNIMDFRSLPGFDSTKDQMPYHRANSQDFQLGGSVCPTETAP